MCRIESCSLARKGQAERQGQQEDRTHRMGQGWLRLVWLESGEEWSPEALCEATEREGGVVMAASHRDHRDLGNSL